MKPETPNGAPLAIGVDLGGTKIMAALVGSDGAVKTTTRRETDVDGGFEGVARQIVDAVNGCRAGVGGTAVEAVGVGVAGQVTSDTGVVTRAPNLFWEDAPLGSFLADALDLPVAVLNDVRAAAWGEWRHGAGGGSEDVAVVFVGTGVGGGVVSGGRMLTGCTNTAGELGHMTVVAHGRECRCGNRGCLEAYVGGWAIAERAREAVAASPKEGKGLVERAGGEDAITAETVHEARADGDPLATRLVDDTAEYLAAGLVGVVNAFNPCRLVLGGGIIDHAPFYVDRVRQHVTARALAAGTRELDVTAAALGDEAGVLGAATFARRGRASSTEGTGRGSSE
ncbi:MAG: ROK family protein [Candidatus Longimicrobiales bacterium M2_2A_002]